MTLPRRGMQVRSESGVRAVLGMGLTLHLGVLGCAVNLPPPSIDTKRRFLPTASTVSLPGDHTVRPFLGAELSRLGCVRHLGTERDADIQLRSVQLDSRAGISTTGQVVWSLFTVVTLTAILGLPWPATAHGEAWSTVYRGEEELGVLHSEADFGFTLNVYSSNQGGRDEAEIVARKRAVSGLAIEIAEAICEPA